MSSDVYERLRREVVAGLDGEQWADDPETRLVRDVVMRAVEGYQQRARLGEGPTLHDPVEMVDRLVRSVTDLGALSELVRSDDVEEIFIEGARVSFLDCDGRLRGLLTPTSEDENRRVVEQLLASTDRQLNATAPLVQARVLGGAARLTAAIPPVADALSATIRRYTVRSVSLPGLVARGSLDPGAAAFLDAAMRFRSRVAVSGEPGAGKTTMLAALLAAVPPEHCVRACEEIRELSASFPLGAYYETRPPALDGSSEITLRQLVKFVLAKFGFPYCLWLTTGRAGGDACDNRRRGLPGEAGSALMRCGRQRFVCVGIRKWS